MEGITYHNKDVASKVMEREFPNKSFEVYGVNLPKIKAALPTNLPVIESNELRLDNLFLFEDGSYGLVDYESKFDEEDKVTYVNYLARVLKGFLHEGQKNVKIHMIVLYTCNVKDVNTELDAGSLHLSIKAGYLNGIDTKQVYEQIKHKVAGQQLLDDKELMQIIVLPLTVADKKEQQMWLKKTIELAKLIEDEKQQIFALSGILTFSDKIVENEYAEEIRRWIQMTKVARLFEMEKEEAVRKVENEKEEAVRKVENEKEEAVRKVENEKEEALRKVENEKEKVLEKAENQRVALKLLLKGEKIEKVIEETGFSKEEIEELMK